LDDFGVGRDGIDGPERRTCHAPSFWI